MFLLKDVAQGQRSQQKKYNIHLRKDQYVSELPSWRFFFHTSTLSYCLNMVSSETLTIIRD